MNRTRFSYEDLIFENRNKAYGAYDLRVNYEANLMKAFFIGLGSLSVIAFTIFWISRSDISDKPMFKETSTFDFTKTFVIEPEIAEVVQPTKQIRKTHFVQQPSTSVDPHTFKLVKQTIEPLAPPIEPPSSPEPIEPLAGTSSGIGPANIFTNTTLVGKVIENYSGPEILSSAIVDKQPMFPGGMEGFYKFLSRNMRFPDAAKKEGISARLFVSFVINIEGNLVEIEFIKKVGYGMEESVTAVLEKSPKWIPGQVGTQQVNTKMILPVNFNLVQ